MSAVLINGDAGHRLSALPMSKRNFSKRAGKSSAVSFVNT
jgi:hypothetical protein